MRNLEFHADLIETAFTKAHTPFMLFKANGELICENKAAFEFIILTYGMEINSLADKRFSDNAVSTDWLARMAECRKTLRIKRWTASYPLFNKENTFTHRSCTLTPLLNKERQVDSFLAECADITNIIEAGKRLKIRNDQMSTVAFTARHDLRGSLDGFLFATDLIHEALNEKQIEALGIDTAMELINMEVEKQTAVLEGLRDWLDMIEGAAIKKELVDLKEVAEKLKKNSLYNGKVIIEELPVLEASGGQFASLFDNLIKNGLHYNDKPERWVKIYANDGAIIIEDNGNGFPIAKFETLCKPFRRLDMSKTGSGLGLAIVKGICDNHGFTFTAESEIGAGSRFIIKYM